MVVRWEAWICDLRMALRIDNSTVDTGSTGITVREGAFFPLDVWIDPFEPRYPQNQLIGAERGDEEDFLVFNAAKGELEGNDTVCMD